MNKVSDIKNYNKNRVIRKIVKFNIFSMVYFYTVIVILYNSIRYYFRIFSNNKILKYPIEDLFLIGFGELIYDISKFIFPVLFLLFFYFLYKKNKNNGCVRIFLTKNLKRNIVFSGLLSFFVVYLNSEYGYNKSFIAFFLVFFHSFMFSVIIFSSFSSLLKDMLPVFKKQHSNKNILNNHK